MKQIFKDSADLQELPCPREAKLRETILASRTAFCRAQDTQRLTPFAFFLEQAGYIRKRWWLAQAAVLVFLWLFLYTFGDSELGDSAFIPSVFGVTAPLLIVFALPELWKNLRCRSTEIEAAAFFTLRRVYTARLIMFGIVDLALCSAFLAVTTATLQLSLCRTSLYLLVPFNLTACTCFTVLAKGWSEHSALSLCLLSMIVWLKLAANARLYETAALWAWTAFLLLSVLYLAFVIQRLLNRCKYNYKEAAIWN